MKLLFFIRKQGYIRFHIPGGGGAEFIKSFGEEYQVVKRERKYHGCGKGEAISSALLRLLGRISSREEGKMTKFSGREIKI